MRLEIQCPDTPACQIDPQLVIYRKTTLAFLRKYYRMSMELGHLPSLLGREFFRTHVTSYTTHTFEDAVIFTHDIERCIAALPPKLQQVVAHTFLQEYTCEETAELMGCSWVSVQRWKGEALDRLADIFVEYGLLEPIKIAEQVAQAKKLGIFKNLDPARYRDVLSTSDTLAVKKRPRSTWAKNAQSLEAEAVNCG